MKKTGTRHFVMRLATAKGQAVILLLLLFIIVSCLPITASASSTSGSCGQNATWNFDEDTGTLIISGTGDMEDYDELYVITGPTTGIGCPAPWDDFASEVQDLIIEPGITSIGHYAFQKCNITSVSIPDSVTRIGAYAFSRCAELQQVEIPYGVELLYAGVFNRCASLTTITIPSSVTTMYGSTFRNCSSLGSITIPDSLKTITSGMFEGCANLASVSISESINSIESDAFDGCDNLKDIYFGGTRGQWNKVSISSGNRPISKASIHYSGQTSSDPYDSFVKTKTYTSGQFIDVSEKYWGAAHIKAAYEYGLMVGTSANRFSPQSNLSIAQTIVLACRLHNIYYYEDKGTFEGPGAWYQPYVDYAKAEGIVTKEYTNYSKAITRWEFAKIMSASLPSEAFPAINTIEDNAIPNVKIRYIDPSATLSELIAYSEFHPKTTEDSELSFWSAVYQLYRAGILSGNDKKGTYKPYSSITRAEAASIITRMAVPSLRVRLTLKAPAFTPVPLNKLANLNSLRSGATNAQLQQAYNKAVEMLRLYANLNKEDQMFWAVMAVGRYRNNYIHYSMSAPHYDDPYGFFVLNTASCAGDTRALGLCLNILGISYEYVNPGAYTHQWARVKLNGKYWVCDADVFCCQAENKPYTHPYLT